MLFPQAATKKQKYEKISEKKMSTPVEVLCKVRETSTLNVNIMYMEAIKHPKRFVKGPRFTVSYTSKMDKIKKGKWEEKSLNFPPRVGFPG